MSVFAESPHDNASQEFPAISPRQTTGGKAKRPARWALGNWPVRWKVLAIVVVPLLLVGVLGGLRVHSGWTTASELRLAADRAELVPSISEYMAALDGALLANSAGGDVQASLNAFDTSKQKLQNQLSATDVEPDVRAGVTGLLDDGQSLLNEVTANGVDLRGPHHRLCADPAVRRGRDQRIGTRRRRTHPCRGARPQSGRGRAWPDGDGAAPGQPRRRTSRTGTAHLDDHVGRHRAVDVVRDVAGARRRLAGRAEAERRNGPADGLMSDPAVGLVANPRTESVAADHQRHRREGRRLDDGGRHLRGRGSSQRQASRGDPRLGDRRSGRPPGARDHAVRGSLPGAAPCGNCATAR